MLLHRCTILSSSSSSSSHLHPNGKVRINRRYGFKVIIQLPPPHLLSLLHLPLTISLFATNPRFSSQGHLHQRDPRSSSSLFDGYDRSASSRSPAAAAAAAPRRDNLRPAAGTSAGPGYGYGYGGGGGGGYGFAAYPNSAEAGFKPVSLSGDTSGYRSATPNSKYALLPFLLKCLSIGTRRILTLRPILQYSGASIPMLCFPPSSRKMMKI